MKVLYSLKELNENNEVFEALSNMPDWDVTPSCGKDSVLTYCSTGYYDVLVIDSTIENSQWLETIKTIRDRQIFTPILVIVENSDPDNMMAGLIEGADMCIPKPLAIQEMILRIRVLKRRNTNYQISTIMFNGIELDRPNGRIYYGNTSLSVNSIEIEVFRLLTRASTEIHTKMLAEKIAENEEKVIFFAKCLQKKIGLLGSNIRLEIKDSKCKLIKKEK